MSGKHVIFAYHKKQTNTMKTVFNITTYIAIFMSMIYVAAVDSMTTSDLVFYLIPVCFIWYVVKLMNDELKKSKK